MLTIIMGVLFALSVGVYKIWDKNTKKYAPDWLEFLSIGLGVLFGFGMIIWPIVYFCTKADIRKVKTLNQTIKTARLDSNTVYERAALTTKIIDYNEYIVETKYMNSIWMWDLYIPDEIDNISLVK